MPLQQDDNIVKLSTIIDSIYYLPLETDDRYLIGNIDKLIVTDGFFYVIDKDISPSIFQGGRSISITSYHFLYFFNTNDFISYFLIPSTGFPLSCHSQFDVTLFQ